MKKIIYVFSIAAISVSMTSCFSGSSDDTRSSLKDLIESAKPSVEYDVVEIEGLYSIKVPKFMTVTTQLHESASLQYNNPFKEKYIIVLDENTEETLSFMNDYGIYDDTKSQLENYVDMRLNFLKESGITVRSQSLVKKEMINGRKAFSTIIEASVPEVSEDIVYYLTYLEGKENFYVVMSWTLMSRKDDYTEEVKEMAASFKEI